MRVQRCPVGEGEMLRSQIFRLQFLRTKGERIIHPGRSPSYVFSCIRFSTYINSLNQNDGLFEEGSGELRSSPPCPPFVAQIFGIDISDDFRGYD